MSDVTEYEELHKSVTSDNLILTISDLLNCLYLLSSQIWILNKWGKPQFEFHFCMKNMWMRKWDSNKNWLRTAKPTLTEKTQYLQFIKSDMILKTKKKYLGSFEELCFSSVLLLIVLYVLSLSVW